MDGSGIARFTYGETVRAPAGLITVNTVLFLSLFLSAMLLAREDTLVWRDPGPIQTLDLAAGPLGRAGAPKAPFTFVKEANGGISPKIVVTDASGKKWMVKFGDEVKAESFASRLAWAAGYPTRVSYYLENGKIEGADKLARAQKFVGSDGAFHGARFQIFDHDGFKEIPGGGFELSDKREDQRELNGLKLMLLLVANWDVKKQNTGLFDIDGRRYALVSDWGASLGDPASPDVVSRKWNCEAFDKRTGTLIDGVENNYVQFNYTQYASRHEHALSDGIRVEDLQWFMNRMGKLTDAQMRAGLLASGATPEEAACFTRALRRRLNSFAAVAAGTHSETVPGQIVRKTTTKIITK